MPEDPKIEPNTTQSGGWSGRKEGCPFCDYTGPSEVLTDNGMFYVIEPLNPVVPGHLLVIPKQHFDSAAVGPVTAGHGMAFAATWAHKAGGDWNIITSIGKAATQTVKHMHIHLVPRRDGDGLPLPWSAK